MAQFIYKHRRGTTEKWQAATSIIPLDGELLVEERADGTVAIKVGDGIHTFNDLPYVSKDKITQSDLSQDLKDEIEGKLDASEVTGDLLTHHASEFATATHDHAITDVTGLPTALDSKVPMSRTVNGKALSADITIDIPNALADLSDDATHRTVTDTEKATWNAKSTFSGSYTDLTNIPSTFAPNDHNHDDKYYTESEIDTKLSDKVNVLDLQEATTSKAGLMSADDKSNLDTIVTSFNSENGNTTIDTVKEVLKAFENAPEGTDIANALAGKADVDHEHPYILDTFKLDYDKAYDHSQDKHAPVDAQANVQSDWNATSGDAFIKNKPTSMTPTVHQHTKSEITDFPTLATVATSGSYNDLIQKPTIPSIEGLATTTYVDNRVSTELVNKVDKTTTVNGHALSDNVTVTKSDIGLGKVENKSSATIRGEITRDNVVSALGYTPLSTVDDALSSTSVNAVQNKVITEALNTRTIKQKSVTYNELKALHDANQLIAGMQYRIIDYVTTTTQQDTQSAGHQFDIIVTALSKDTLSENARAIKHGIAGGMSPEDVHILFEFGAGGYDADDTVADFGYEANNQGQTVPVIYFDMETDDGDVVTNFEDKWFYIDEYEFDGNVYSRWRLIEINSTDGCWTWDSPYRKYILTQPIVDDGQITVDDPADIDIAYKMYDDVDHIYEGPHSPGDVIVELSYGENEDGEVVPMLFKTDVTNSDVVDNEPDYGDPIFYVGRHEYHGEVYDRWRKVESYNWEEGYRRYMLTNIVVGDDGKFLSGSAYDYFTDANLPAWEIKYSLDNDDTRFAWADTENGKGVIYYMKDEWDNECHYDFKNIMFKRNAEWFTEHDDWTQSVFGKSIDTDRWFYTFTWIDENDETLDLSLIGNTLLNEEQTIDGIHSNKIGVVSAYSMGINKKTVEALSGNIFVNSSTYDTLFYGCKGNVLGVDCVENTFGPDCKYSLLDSYCKYNTVGAHSKSNIFETGCIRVNVTGEYIYNVRICQGVGYTTLSPESEASHQQIYRKSGTQEILVD